MTEPAHVAQTRAAYDTVAVDDARLLEAELARSPLDRALLGHFAELVELEGGGPVIDVGCGPGRITGHLATLGLEVSGIDLSPGMVAEARRRHPAIHFRTGALADLDGATAQSSPGGSRVTAEPELPQVVCRAARARATRSMRS